MYPARRIKVAMGLREYEANVVFVRRPDNFIGFDTANVYLQY